MIRKILFPLVCAILGISQTHADNWGHWRGPTGNGVAENATPPTEWSDTKLQLVMSCHGERLL